jgi:hypothetical protein
MIQFDDKTFMKDMTNLVKYSIGYVDGIVQGREKFLDIVGKRVSVILGNFIDSNARVNPAALHHVYEWYQSGNEGGRLFEITSMAAGSVIEFGSSFTQSRTIKEGSKEPFFDKASIMENGTPVTIRAKASDVLMFDDNGETIFTKQDITVENPGGEDVAGEYERTFKSFFENYFSQSFIQQSGLGHYLSNPTSYSSNFASGVKSGSQVGIKAGYNWIVDAGVSI